jgi:hypothetical protein
MRRGWASFVCRADHNDIEMLAFASQYKGQVAVHAQMRRNREPFRLCMDRPCVASEFVVG